MNSQFSYTCTLNNIQSPQITYCLKSRPYKQTNLEEHKCYDILFIAVCWPAAC